MNKQETDFVDRILDNNSRLRAENHRIVVFLRALTDPDMYGHAVNAEVRQAAAALLNGIRGAE